MVYIFTFGGEFGYELFNWQGVIRKFSHTISASDRIVCCSRANLYPLYETAHQYIDISEIEMFRQSVACGYFALHPEDLTLNSPQNLDFDRRLKKELKTFILKRLAEGLPPSLLRSLWRNLLPGGSNYQFVFSSEKTELNGCRFGCDRTRFGTDPSEGNIYDLLDLKNNEYKVIEAPLEARQAIEKTLGWSLETPFVLCQTRARDIVIRSKCRVPKERLIEQLSRKVKVVLLSFATGRALDSYSAFRGLPDCYSYACGSFVEQACLVHFAKRCVFFTEGDFGSHMYVPPFLGKDVVAIAPGDIYDLGTTPIDFWNRNVFRFGGQIIPKISEEVFASQRTVSRFIDELVAP